DELLRGENFKFLACILGKTWYIAGVPSAAASVTRRRRGCWAGHFFCISWLRASHVLARSVTVKERDFWSRKSSTGVGNVTDPAANHCLGPGPCKPVRPLWPGARSLAARSAAQSSAAGAAELLPPGRQIDRGCGTRAAHRPVSTPKPGPAPVQ